MTVLIADHVVRQIAVHIRIREHRADDAEGRELRRPSIEDEEPHALAQHSRQLLSSARLIQPPDVDPRINSIIY